MSDIIYISLINNSLLLLVLSVIFEMEYLISEKKAKYKKTIKGILTGIICIVVMSVPYTFAQGVILDTRSVLLSVTAFVIGPIPAIIAATMALIYRIYLGGIGVFAGIGIIFTSTAIGLLWRRFAKLKLQKHKALNLYLMSLSVHVTMILCMLLMPFEDSLVIIRATSFTVLIIYPFTSMILSLLLLNQHQRRGVQEKLKQSEKMMSYIIEHNKNAIAVHDKDLKYLYVSQSYIDSFNLNGRDIIGKYYYDLFPESYSKWNEIYKKVLKGDVLYSEEDHFNYNDDKKGWVRWECRPWYDQDGSIGGLILYIEEISKRVKMQLEIRNMKDHLENLINNGNAPVIVCDSDLNIITFSKSAAELTGKNGKSVIGEYIGVVFPEWAIKKLEWSIERGEKNFETEPDELNFIGNDGTKKTVLWNRTVILNDKVNDNFSVLLQGQDITNIKKAEEHLRYFSYHDQLTGLYNRRYFEETLKEIDTPQNLPISIIMCDINGLKIVNDSLGHIAGDNLLKKAAEILLSAIDFNNNIHVARIGGDEFVLMCPKTNSESAKAIMNRIEKNAAEYKNTDMKISIALGFDTKEIEKIDIMRTLVNAENCMYRQKINQRESVRSQAIGFVMQTLFAKSPYESSHSERVSKICSAIAAEMDYGQDEINQIRIAGLMHDIGKITIDKSVLTKERELDDYETSEIKKHPEIGWRILNSLPQFSELADFVLHHHERWDGKGYPNGIKGEKIPIQSRIIALADAYDAMTGVITYKPKLTKAQALSEIKTCSGTQFDPHIAGIFINMLNREEKEF